MHPNAPKGIAMSIHPIFRQFVALLLLMILAGCTYQSETLDTLRCQPDGRVDGERKCENGIWVQTGQTDMPTDTPVDLPDMPIDQPVDLPDMVDMPDMPDMPDMCISDDTTEQCKNFCGTLLFTDNCGRPIDCGGCGENEACENNACVCQEESEAELCAQNNRVCGELTVVDRCNKQRVISCGTCQAPKLCNMQGQCECTAETDIIFCGRLGAQCGSVTQPDNCGDVRTVDCGDCNGQNNCNMADNTCPVCQPETNAQFCARNNAVCGEVIAMDNCNQMRTVDCGGCGADESCANNQCVCDDAVCQMGDECGAVTNACGNVRMCGTCTNDNVCNTTTRKCECPTPTMCMPGDECGTRENQCGNSVSCGTCMGTDVCNTTTRKCECTPESDAQFCSRNNAVCGMFTGNDNCGDARTIDCGGCGADENCTNNQCVCTPETDVQFCTRNNAVCGMLTGMDNCMMMRTVASCGTCANGMCGNNNQCNTTVKLTSTVNQNDEAFGTSISVAGNIMAIGAPGRDVMDSQGQTIIDAGAVDIYEFDAGTGTWTFTNSINAGANIQSGARFGHAVDLYVTRLLVGSPNEAQGGNANTGAGYLFERLGTGVWQNKERISRSGQAQSFIGTAVDLEDKTYALSAPGDANSPGSIYTYVDCAADYTGCNRVIMRPSGTPNGAAFGAGLILTDAFLIGGAPNWGSGQVSIYSATGMRNTPWTLISNLTPQSAAADARFGLALAQAGTTVMIGAPALTGLGQVYLYDQLNPPGPNPMVTNGVLSATLAFANQNTNDQAGKSLSMTSDGLVVGAPTDSASLGAAYYFQFVNNSWTQTSRLTAFDTPAAGQFGAATAINASTMFIGAPGANAVYITPR